MKKNKENTSVYKQFEEKSVECLNAYICPWKGGERYGL